MGERAHNLWGQMFLRFNLVSTHYYEAQGKFYFSELCPYRLNGDNSIPTSQESGEDKI